MKPDLCDLLMDSSNGARQIHGNNFCANANGFILTIFTKRCEYNIDWRNTESDNVTLVIFIPKWIWLQFSQHQGRIAIFKSPYNFKPQQNFRTTLFLNYAENHNDCIVFIAWMKLRSCEENYYLLFENVFWYVSDTLLREIGRKCEWTSWASALLDIHGWLSSS